VDGERRFSETEVEEILRRATDRRSGLPARGDAQEGMTLRELQEIGHEVGIPAEALADAARSLDRPQGIQRTLGLPLTVERTVTLPRDMTDLEWELLVGDLRETFRARGKVQQLGRLRQWTNGNLHALVEPTQDGYRLRLGTTKGDARQLMAAGGVILSFVTLLALLGLLGVGGEPEKLLRAFSILGPVGVAVFAAGAIRLPGWARTREAQMDAIAERVNGMMALPPGQPESD
jgi:hypothetical protein